MNAIDQKYTLKEYILLFAQGFCIGIANAIPGVSGGTVAFLFGLYEDLINSIRSFDLSFIKKLFQGKISVALDHVAWRFLGSVILGAVFSILCFSKAISWLITYKPVQVNAFFFGLILASIPVIARIIQKWNLFLFINILISAFITHLIVSSVPVNTSDSLPFIFLCGVLAISSMILPGLSGAFILVLLGKYTHIINAINDRDLVVLGTFLLGIIIGILSFVRLLSWLFKKYHDGTISVLTGLIIGSLSKIWPWKKALEYLEVKPGKLVLIKEINVLPDAFTREVAGAIGLMLVGIILTLLLNRSPKKRIL